MTREAGTVSQKAFTLIEVLIVVAIIAILAALIIPRFGSQLRRARTAEATGIMAMIHEGVIAWSDEHGGPGNFPAAEDDEGVIKTTLTVDWDAPQHGWTFEISDAAGTVTAVKDGDAANTLTLDATGEWCGTGIYDPATGGDWPQLSPHC